MGKIRVLVVDDSAIVRNTMTEILESDNGIEVIGSAADPFAAAKKMMESVPDVITLDIEMPRMDGLTFLRKIMSQHPVPVVVCSSLATNGSETVMRCMEYGAVEIIEKPRVGTRQFLEESRIRITDAVRAAAHANLKRVAAKPVVVQPKLSADAVISAPPVHNHTSLTTTEKILCVGASTGGTEALRVFLEAMPPNCPGIAIVQHMPEKFTAAFAQRLDGLCRITVREAQNNDSILRGQALIAPGNRHMLLKRSGARYYVELRDGPLVSRHRPSVDVLFRSAARYGGPNVIGVIMTGMGDDGAKGMKEMKDAGAYNIAQDEATCVVFGMPQEAIKAGAVDSVMPLERLAPESCRLAR
ncbi:two-component system chemotaxis response regulator CheB [Desulfobaculum xiamenense]|uniref:Protein-glutamate methylesterase/protein-glutamine glutaminase n=1 Tax=Desulfobaculum xiamenense TaxID=995050 RepID=A0A846QJE7_9BACT|nr:chemotaxis response regulator protein-glutamate methylesterase [Desulfobaculum xiamenense]NJB66602.1 two-component system chemotaxis response regulator CheB [Desulfobaculum xiamenense]